MSERMPVIFVGRREVHERTPRELLYPRLERARRKSASTARHSGRLRTLVCIAGYRGHGDGAAHGHDFGGSLRSCFAVRYGAPGDPALAREVQRLLPLRVELDETGGSITAPGPFSNTCIRPPIFPWFNSASTKHSRQIFTTDRTALRELRDAGVLILGSGDVCTTCTPMPGGSGRLPLSTGPCVSNARARVAHEGRSWPSHRLPVDGLDALLSIPTPEHYLPLLYVLGASEPGTSSVSGRRHRRWFGVDAQRAPRLKRVWRDTFKNGRQRRKPLRSKPACAPIVNPFAEA